VNDDGTGTVWTAVAHIVTGVIGSGVLSLAWSIAQLGWIGGPLTIVFFACITLLSSFLLSNTYRSPDPEHGPQRSSSYLDAVNLHKGNLQHFVFTIFFSLCTVLCCYLFLMIRDGGKAGGNHGVKTCSVVTFCKQMKIGK